MSAKYKTLTAAIALALAIFAVFSQVVHSKFVYFDDPQYTMENTHIQHVAILQPVNWDLKKSKI